MTSPTIPEPSLGEWACLGVLAERPAHGWAVARRLRPDGDIGRVWSLSRPLTYRSLDRLVERGWAAPVGEEPGAGPNRTVLAVTSAGATQLGTWVRTPVEHLRDLRSELLVKLVVADLLGLDLGRMPDEQRAIVDRLAAVIGAEAGADPDVVTMWRLEAADAARRFLDRLP